MTHPTKEVGHILNEAFNEKNAKKRCPTCGSDFRKWRVVDYNEIWRDGKVICSVCDTFIRDYDAG